MLPPLREIQSEGGFLRHLSLSQALHPPTVTAEIAAGMNGPCAQSPPGGSSVSEATVNMTRAGSQRPGSPSARSRSAQKLAGDPRCLRRRATWPRDPRLGTVEAVSCLRCLRSPSIYLPLPKKYRGILRPVFPRRPIYKPTVDTVDMRQRTTKWPKTSRFGNGRAVYGQTEHRRHPRHARPNQLTLWAWASSARSLPKSASTALISASSSGLVASGFASCSAGVSCFEVHEGSKGQASSRGGMRL